MRGGKPSPPGTSDKQRAEWQLADGVGWQHGDVPECPDGLTDAGREAWAVWFGSWWACFWTPDDVPGLKLTVKNYDGVMGGHLDVSKVIPLLDKYGITPHGRQSLRWAPPAGQVDDAPEVDNELEKRRQARSRKVS